jgi:hypothetical protein
MEIAVPVFIGGLILWWIIRSDLEKMDFQKMMRELNEKRDALAEADRREADAIRRKNRAFLVRRERYLKRCQEECCTAQDGEGLLSITDVGRILGWGAYESFDGKTQYAFYGHVSSGLNGECYATDNEHPFPKQVRNGLFSSSDVIKWLEEEVQDGRRREQYFT